MLYLTKDGIKDITPDAVQLATRGGTSHTYYEMTVDLCGHTPHILCESGSMYKIAAPGEMEP